MKKETLSTIFQIIQIIAIGYLVFKMLQPSGVNARLDEIEKAQIEIKINQQKIIESNAANFAIYDSTNRIHVRKIDSLTRSVDNNIYQLRRVNKSINDWASVFKENKVILPDPDK